MFAIRFELRRVHPFDTDHADSACQRRIYAWDDDSPELSSCFPLLILRAAFTGVQLVPSQRRTTQTCNRASGRIPSDDDRIQAATDRSPVPARQAISAR